LKHFSFRLEHERLKLEHERKRELEKIEREKEEMKRLQDINRYVFQIQSTPLSSDNGSSGQPLYSDITNNGIK